ncbi:MAG: hypothetical protein BJ554DRAFT_296 [Olpidium bornovanus]|uniref:Uncharacterized protein n=1 Tax=Olpidium bornovanus TaxID=278681 RepID=A0A8H7ZTH6_9FUNG|nr:MAG: hypothetical protein BJ554DRAFT_296 [Olpidium bornovanus]
MAAAQAGAAAAPHDRAGLARAAAGALGQPPPPQLDHSQQQRFRSPAINTAALADAARKDLCAVLDSVRASSAEPRLESCLAFAGRRKNRPNGGMFRPALQSPRASGLR